MRKNKKFTLAEISDYVGGRILDHTAKTNIITHLANLSEANTSSLVIFHNKKYLQEFLNSKAGACIVSENFISFAPKGMSLILHPNPYKAFALVTKLFNGLELSDKSFIAPTACISPSAKIGENCRIEHGVYIADGVTIGKGCKIGVNTYIGTNVSIGDYCQIENQVSIENTQMGSHVIIYPGARIGQEGFGFASDKEGHYKIYHQGLVVIGDDVEIGANTCIDRGTLGHTVISDHVRLDNLIQIAHNVKVGKYTVIAGQTGIAGSSIIGERVVLGGQVGVSGHIEIESGSSVLGKSLVIKNIPSKSRVGGVPAIPYQQAHRQHIFLKKMVNKQFNLEFK